MSNAPSPTIRDADAGDAAAVAAIYNAHVDRGDCTMDQAHWTAEQVADRLAALDPREALIVAELAGRVLGWGAVKRYSDRRGYRSCCETSVYVDASQTGRGLGQAVMDELVARLERLGYHHALVRIFAANARSRRFHERNGFRTVGILHEVGHVDGRWIDVVIMERIFPHVTPPK